MGGLAQSVGAYGVGIWAHVGCRMQRFRLWRLRVSVGGIKARMVGSRNGNKARIMLLYNDNRESKEKLHKCIIIPMQGKTFYFRHRGEYIRRHIMLFLCIEPKPSA